MPGEGAELDPTDAEEEGEGTAPRPQLLIDSDAFVLLAAAGLLDRAITCLGFARDDARRLDALAGMLRRGKTFADLTEMERACAETWCDRIAPFRESPSPDSMQQLAGIANIDSPEATLFATCYDNPKAVLLTGDKRALRALAKRAPVFCQSLNGRVACLEQVVACMVRSDGVADIFSALASRVLHHKTLTVCLSEVNRANQGECLRVLQVYIDDVAKDMPANWLRSVR